MSKKQKVYLPFKRLIAMVGSLIGILVMVFLFWWWIFIVNLFSTHGHPVFAQERVGKNGKSFKLLKFRSMEEKELEGEYERVTKFGKFLRKTSLDETLQLLNIFAFQMTFIGPRPLVNKNDDTITIEIRKQNGSIALCPGLSGYAQVNGRTNVSPEDKGKLDGYYYEHISFFFDLKIFFKTIGTLFKKQNIDSIK